MSGSFVAAGAGRMVADRGGRRRVRGEAGAGGETVHAHPVGAPRRGRPDPAVGDVRDRADRRAVVRQPAASPRQLAQGRVQARSPGTVAMVPEGLVLLMSVAFAVAVLRLAKRERAGAGAAGRRGARARGRALHRQDGDAHRGQARGRVGRAAQRRGATSRTRSRRSRPPTSTPTRRWRRSANGSRPCRAAGRRPRAVPFSSARKWSAVTFGERGSWLVGGADVLIGDERRGERPRGRRGGGRIAGAGPGARRRAAAGRRAPAVAPTGGARGAEGHAPARTPRRRSPTSASRASR